LEQAVQKRMELERMDIQSAESSQLKRKRTETPSISKTAAEKENIEKRARPDFVPVTKYGVEAIPLAETVPQVGVVKVTLPLDPTGEMADTEANKDATAPSHGFLAPATPTQSSAPSELQESPQRSGTPFCIKETPMTCPSAIMSHESLSERQSSSSLKPPPIEAPPPNILAGTTTPPPPPAPTSFSASSPSMAHTIHARSPALSTSGTIFRYAKPPPTIEEVLKYIEEATLRDNKKKLIKRDYLEPFFGKPSDAPSRPKVFGGITFKPPAGKLEALKEFDNSEILPGKADVIKGLNHWKKVFNVGQEQADKRKQKGKEKMRDKGKEKEKEKERDATSEKGRIKEGKGKKSYLYVVAKPPPSREEVERWLLIESRDAQQQQQPVGFKRIADETPAEGQQQQGEGEKRPVASVTWKHLQFVGNPEAGEGVRVKELPYAAPPPEGVMNALPLAELRRLEKGKQKVRESEDHSQIDVATPSNTAGFGFAVPSIGPRSNAAAGYSLHDRQHVTIMSIEVHGTLCFFFYFIQR